MFKFERMGIICSSFFVIQYKIFYKRFFNSKTLYNFTSTTMKNNNKMKNSIKLIEITIEQAINHSQNSYNPYEWKKRVIQLQNWFPGVKFFEHNNEVYYIYNTNGIKSINRLEYFSSLDNGGLKALVFNNNILEDDFIRISKNDEGLKLAKKLCKMSDKIVFASVFFSI